MKKTHGYLNYAWLSTVALLCLSGCNTLFDAPSETVASSGLSAQELSDLQALAQAQSLEALGTVASQDVGIAGSAISHPSMKPYKASNKVRLLSQGQAKEPVIFFEKIASPIPQLVILSPGANAISWGGKAMQIPPSTASHVFLIQPGRHELIIDYSGSTPFKADVLVAHHERVTLRINAETGSTPPNNP